GRRIRDHVNLLLVCVHGHREEQTSERFDFGRAIRDAQEHLRKKAIYKNQGIVGVCDAISRAATTRLPLAEVNILPSLTSFIKKRKRSAIKGVKPKGSEDSSLGLRRSTKVHPVRFSLVSFTGVHLVLRSQSARRCARNAPEHRRRLGRQSLRHDSGS